jgi:hypothetical protein
MKEQPAKKVSSGFFVCQMLHNDSSGTPLLLLLLLLFAGRSRDGERALINQSRWHMCGDVRFRFLGIT